jgi:hypothetical protein
MPFRPVLLAGLVLGILTGCADPGSAPPADSQSQSPPPLPLATQADSVAYRVVEASGGLDAWQALPALRFEFGIERDGQQQVAARHYWDKTQNRYRVEWPGGGDTTYVALFSSWPDSAAVYAGAEPLEGAAAEEALTTARRRTINDTYWLLAPFKLFDPGVTRTYVPDSSDATTDAIRLSFDDVGMTPGDRYWLFVDKATGQLQRWTFVLEGDTTPRSFDWTAYQTLPGPDGPVYLSARKEAVGAPVAILTDALRAPATVDSTLFSDPSPRL